MLIVCCVCIVVAVVALVFAARCYSELRTWSREMNTAQIAIAYKRKVKVVAPLTEWMLWTRQLSKDESANGRTVYLMGGTSVALIKSRKDGKKPQQETKDTAKQRSQGLARGTWAATDDKTGAKQKVAGQ